MADDEQFSLCWNNFNSNLSAGFHESLCRGDLVDVTLAAEGQLVKAHRLVLSVCSPYFRKMFTQMPANQHAFVFLKDVSHTALKDLIQFMYCGEVNVKQEALPAFISTAEALQIKGLTDSDPPPSASPNEPSTPSPQIPQIPSPRVRQQRSSTTRSYKIETIDDSGDDKPPTQIVIQTTSSPQNPIAQTQTSHLQSHTHNSAQQISTTPATTTVLSHKRPAQRSVSNVPHIKRTKSTIDPLDAADTANAQITVQTTVVTDKAQQSDTEYIDMPMEIPTKSEPDYADDSGDVGGPDHDATYVEDDSYGDMRYDESYFTENDDGTASTSVSTTVAATSGMNVNNGSPATTSKGIIKQQQSFSDSSFVDNADQTTNDAQDTLLKEKTDGNSTSPNAVKKRKPGRPRKQNKDETAAIPLMDKISTAIRNNQPSRPVYASTTKGGMKLIYDGHHFRYSFRKGQYSIFQCCYKENKEECKVRVVSDQKRVYPLDGEHVHYMLATCKSVTSVMFEPELNEENEEGEYIPTNEDEHPKQYEKNLTNTPIKIHNLSNVVEIELPLHDETESISKTEVFEEVLNDAQDPIDFREKIKKRLQKALLGKKK